MDLISLETSIGLWIEPFIRANITAPEDGPEERRSLSGICGPQSKVKNLTGLLKEREERVTRGQFIP